MGKNIQETKKVWVAPKLVVHGDVHQLTTVPDPPGKQLGFHDVQNTQQPSGWAS